MLPWYKITISMLLQLTKCTTSLTFLCFTNKTIITRGLHDFVVSLKVRLLLLGCEVKGYGNKLREV